MIELRTPRGLLVKVPEHIGEDLSPRFLPTESVDIKKYYDENGYVIVRNVIDGETCDRVRSLWDREVKPSREFIYRQATAKAERHVLNEQGWVMNPILNLQSVDPKKYPEFRTFSTQKILTADRLCQIFATLFAEKPKIVQSMYFEGNSATWEHQDSYYLDSERIGSMCAAWLAIEDIAATAGRFFVCPGSHRIDMGRQNYQNNIAANHETYIQSVVRKVRALGLPIRAPFLAKGDVLFWNAWTIHGSLDSQDAHHSRSSITCHAIPDSHRFLQLQTRTKKLDIERINGINVHCPKDLAKVTNRMIFNIEANNPKAFYLAKNTALKLLFRLKRAA